MRFLTLLIFIVISVNGTAQVDTTYCTNPDVWAQPVHNSYLTWLIGKTSEIDSLCYDEPTRFFYEIIVEKDGYVSSFSIYQQNDVAEECLLKSFPTENAPRFLPAMNKGQVCRQKMRSKVNICFSN